MRNVPGLSLLLPFLAFAGLAAAPAVEPSIAEAAKNGDSVTIAALVKSHTDVNVPTADGSTALHWAAHRDDAATVETLIHAGAKVNVANRYGATPLWIACSNGSLSVVTALVSAGANPNMLALEGESPLMAATRGGNIKVVELLLAHGADVRVQDAWKGQTALMWAVGDFERHTEIARVLVEHHSDVNASSKRGFTPLLFALRQGDTDAVHLLVEAGADVNHPSPDGGNMLIAAITNSRYSVAQYLLEKGANPNAADKQGFTPLQHAVRKRPSGSKQALTLMSALASHGAEVNARTPLVRLTWPDDHEVTPRPIIDEIEFGGATAFWIAANAGDVEGLRLLLSLGADPTIVTVEQTTPLMVAAGLGYGTRGPTARLGGRVGAEGGEGRDQSTTDPGGLEAVKFLLEHGADINAANDNGQTALHGAASAANPEVSKFLLEHGANPSLKDNIGRTPLGVAEDNRTDKYRANQNLSPALIESTWALLHKIPTTTER